MWRIVYIPFCSFMKPVVWRPPSLPAKLAVSCIMLTIFSTEEVVFFGAGPPPVIFFSLLYSVKADLAFDVKFLHLSFISFTLLGATSKALILLVTFFYILAFSRFVTEFECLSLNISKLFSTSLWSMDSSNVEKFAFLALGTFFWFSSLNSILTADDRGARCFSQLHFG